MNSPAPADAPLELVALFASPAAGAPDPIAGEPGAVPLPLCDALRWLDAAEFALQFGADELRAAAGAAVAWRLRCGDAAAWPERAAGTAGQVARCHALGALAVLLPAARKALGPAALAALLPALAGDAARLKLFVQVSAAADGRWLRTGTRGMGYLGLPDLVCRTPRANGGLAAQLLEGCIVHLMAHGPDALPPGMVLEATAADGSFLSRLRIDTAPSAGDGSGMRHLVALPGGPGDDAAQAAAPWARLDAAVAARQRVVDLDLRGAVLCALDLAGLQADRLDLSHADLRGTLLRQARLGGCRLNGAQLADIDAEGAVLRVCTLDGAHAAGAGFDAARIEDSSARGADLPAASLRAARLGETTFERAVLREAALDGASGDGVVFRGADLAGASLAGAQFEDGDFRGADLRGADLRGGRFGSADFRGALLDGARFDAADLAAARFDAGEDPRQPAADRDAARPPFDSDLKATLRQLGLGAAARPEGLGIDPLVRNGAGSGMAGVTGLLAGLLDPASAAAQGEAGERVAAVLNDLLQRLHGLERSAETPAAWVEQMQALLNDALPPLAGVLGEADWQALSRLLSQLQHAAVPAGAAGDRATVATRSGSDDPARATEDAS